MQTLILNQTTDVVENVFQHKLLEPVIIKNESGLNYLVLPQGHWQDIFITLYTSFTSLNRVEPEIYNNESDTMKPTEFYAKWHGVLKDADVSNWKEDYINYLEEKYK